MSTVTFPRLVFDSDLLKASFFLIECLHRLWIYEFIFVFLTYSYVRFGLKIKYGYIDGIMCALPECSAIFNISLYTIGKREANCSCMLMKNTIAHSNTFKHSTHNTNTELETKTKEEYYICNMFRPLSNRWCLMNILQNMVSHTRPSVCVRTNAGRDRDSRQYGRPRHSIGKEYRRTTDKNSIIIIPVSHIDERSWKNTRIQHNIECACVYTVQLPIRFLP